MSCCWLSFLRQLFFSPVIHPHLAIVDLIVTLFTAGESLLLSQLHMHCWGEEDNPTKSIITHVNTIAGMGFGWTCPSFLEQINTFLSVHMSPLTSRTTPTTTALTLRAIVCGIFTVVN